MKLNKDYRYRYEMNERFGAWEHAYIIVSAHGAIHLHVTEYDPDGTLKELEESAGLETHYRTPPEYMKNQAPSHDRCAVLSSGPCWHDGTSMYAMEHYLPIWRSRTSEKEMFSFLVQEMDRLVPAEDEETP